MVFLCSNKKEHEWIFNKSGPYAVFWGIKNWKRMRHKEKGHMNWILAWWFANIDWLDRYTFGPTRRMKTQRYVDILSLISTENWNNKKNEQRDGRKSQVNKDTKWRLPIDNFCLTMPPSTARRKSNSLRSKLDWKFV